MYYQIKNGQAEQVQSPANVSNYDLILAQMPVSERQALGIYSKMLYSAEAVTATADPILDTIFAPLPPEPPQEAKKYDRMKLLDELAKRNLLQVFDAFMSQDPKARWYFTTAPFLLETHEVFITAMNALVNIANVPQTEVDDILSKSLI